MRPPLVFIIGTNPITTSHSVFDPRASDIGSPGVVVIRHIGDMEVDTAITAKKLCIRMIVMKMPPCIRYSCTKGPFAQVRRLIGRVTDGNIRNFCFNTEAVQIPRAVCVAPIYPRGTAEQYAITEVGIESRKAATNGEGN